MSGLPWTRNAGMDSSSQPAGPVVTVRCEMSLKERRSQRPSRLDDEPRDRAVVGVDEGERAAARWPAGRARRSRRRARTATAVTFGPGLGDDPLDARADAGARASSSDSPSGITSQRSSAKTRWMIGSPRPARTRYSPPSNSPRNTSREVGQHDAARGRRRLGERRRRLLRAPQRRDEDRVRSLVREPLGRPSRACERPASDSGGSEWPSTSGNLRALDRGLGGAVAHQDDLGGPWRQLVWMLLEAVAVRHAPVSRRPASRAP